MESFAAPNPYGFAGSYYGTPERYEMNRYAYRLGNRGSEEPEQPQAAALRVPSQEEAELQHVALEDERSRLKTTGETERQRRIKAEQNAAAYKERMLALEKIVVEQQKRLDEQDA